MKRPVHPFNDRGGFGSRPSRETMDEIKRLQSNGQRIEALSLIRENIEKYPKDPYLYLNGAITLTRLGEAQQEQDNMRGAEQYWQASLNFCIAGLRHAPSDRKLLEQAGKNLRQIGDWETAEKFYLHSLLIDPTDKKSWTGTGDLYKRWAKVDSLTAEDRQDAYQNAADCYSHALRIDPSDTTAAFKLQELEERGYTGDPDGFSLDSPVHDLIFGTEKQDAGTGLDNLSVPKPGLPG